MSKPLKHKCPTCGKMDADKKGDECKSCYETDIFDECDIKPFFRIRMTQAPPFASRDLHF